MDDYEDHWGNFLWMIFGKIGLAIWYVAEMIWKGIKWIGKGIALAIAYIVYGVK